MPYKQWEVLEVPPSGLSHTLASPHHPRYPARDLTLLSPVPYTVLTALSAPKPLPEAIYCSNHPPNPCMPAAYQHSSPKSISQRNEYSDTRLCVY